MVCDHCGSEAHRTGSSGCSKYCALCKAPGHRQKSGSCPFRECSKCKAVGHSARECDPLYALTVAQKRIELSTLAAQSTARCAKHPVIDRSLARAHSVSVASANKSDTRLENAKSKATAPLGMMSTMAEILWMMLTIKMPTPAR